MALGPKVNKKTPRRQEYRFAFSLALAAATRPESSQLQQLPTHRPHCAWQTDTFVGSSHGSSEVSKRPWDHSCLSICIHRSRPRLQIGSFTKRDGDGFFYELPGNEVHMLTMVSEFR
ncbi:hypothetical protein BD309DRAFT_469210 [Dichomitus squalens]|nr:hypothetical protein BD309DRAFT_469210 [Dichomitus squalens]